MRTLELGRTPLTMKDSDQLVNNCRGTVAFSRPCGQVMHRLMMVAGFILAIGFAPQLDALPGTVGNVIVERVTERIEVPATGGGNVYTLDPDMPAGKIEEMAGGSPGFIERVISRITIDGVVRSERVISESQLDPIPAGMRISSKGFDVPQETLQLDRVVTMESTAYTPDAGLGSRATFRTATGRRAKFGVVAVDPRVIPLHSVVFVEGYGLAVAADTGGAIRGNIVDVCVNEFRTARIWGRRDVRVHIFKDKVPESWQP
ncbi:MAG: hypothetical protein KF812_06395 [Fimbriimonadaceae bacterium]|nr:hypothetical protein [Fimbriimonadaceae bacterium]